MWYYSLFACDRRKKKRRNVHNEGLKAYKRTHTIYIYCLHSHSRFGGATTTIATIAVTATTTTATVTAIMSSPSHFSDSVPRSIFSGGIFHCCVELKWALLCPIHCSLSFFVLAQFSSQSDLFKFARSSYSSLDCYCLDSQPMPTSFSFYLLCVWHSPLSLSLSRFACYE